MSTADTQDSASEETGTKATGKESLPEVTFSKYEEEDDGNDNNAQGEQPDAALDGKHRATRARHQAEARLPSNDQVR